MPSDDSGALARRSSVGDRVALEELLQRHLPGLRAFARLRMSPLLRAHESSHDLVQSACCAVIAGLDRFEYRGEEAFRGWLYTAVYNKLLEHERSARALKRDLSREVPLDPGSSSASPLATIYAQVLSPTQQLHAEERIREIEAAFDSLPDDYREVIALSRVARMSRAAIAAHLGKSEAAVRNSLARALSDLALKLERTRTSDRA